jgi:arylsulfatase A-like enzyme
MRVPFAATGLCVLLAIPFCGHTDAQSLYPPILPDSAAIAAKKKYLRELGESTGGGGGPNIIILMADDLGRNDIELYCPEGINTPNLNRLAAEGIVFSQAYSTSSVCNPSRAGMVTGRYQQRFGNERQIMGRYANSRLEHFVFRHLIDTRPLCLADPWYSPPQEEIRKQGLPESEISLFELMRAVGYRTACIGKWHLGYNEPFLPENRGIEEFYGFYEAFSLYAPKRSGDIVNHKHKIFQNRHIWRMKRKGPSAIVHKGREIEEKGYLTTRIAEEASRFIRQNAGVPFLLYVPFNAPHTPFQAPDSCCKRFPDIKDKNRKVYCGMIAALDDAVGEITAQVRESGIEENTLIFFCSDNGGATYTGATDNGDLKGGKMTDFEGGVNVPLIMKWKGRLDGGQWYHAPVSLMDIFTTSVSACRIPFPGGIPLDGVDLLPFLAGKNTGLPHEYLFWRTDFNKSVRNGRWKLIVNTRDDRLLLYDLEADKQENHNLKNDHPETADRLMGKLASWESELIPPLWPGVMEYEEEIDGVKMRFAF